jgi:hypothetical protein
MIIRRLSELGLVDSMLPAELHLERLVEGIAVASRDDETEYVPEDRQSLRRYQVISAPRDFAFSEPAQHCIIILSFKQNEP